MQEFRPFQREALDALVGPGHLLVVAPTGSGKSLIYQETARRPGFRTLLVTPLVALARQQRDALQGRGLRTSYWGGGGGTRASRDAEHESQVWIASPEGLQSPQRRDELARWRPNFLVVDECHCLWEWGSGFRPAFLEIPRLVEQLRIPRSVWLTATLPLAAREDLEARLPAGIRRLGEFDLPPRLDLRVARVPWPGRADALASWLRLRTGAGLIFVNTRESCVRVQRLLEALGKTVLVYHAGMSAEERLELERRVEEERPEVVVATSAFGMGMHYPHLEWVVHWQAPPSLLALAQAVGRVGRGEERNGHALVLWDPEDFRLNEWIAAGSSRRERELRETLEFLCAQRCRRSLLRAYFGASEGAARCGRCDYCA